MENRLRLIVLSSIVALLAGCSSNSAGNVENQDSDGYEVVERSRAAQSPYQLSLPGSSIQPALISTSWPDTSDYPESSPLPKKATWPDLSQAKNQNSSVVDLLLQGPSAPMEATIARYAQVDSSGIPLGDPTVETCTVGSTDPLSSCSIDQTLGQSETSSVHIAAANPEDRYFAFQATWVVDTHDGPEDLTLAWGFQVIQ